MKTTWLAGICVGVLMAGCAEQKAAPTTSTPPLSASERSDKAIKDPFGYSPDWSDTEIGGSDIENDMHRRQAHRRAANAKTP